MSRAKPIAKHRQEGTFRPGRHAKPKPRSDRKRPKPPPNLKHEASAAWDEICDALESLGLLSSADAALLEVAATALARLRQVRIAGADLTVFNGRQLNPQVRLELLAGQQLRLALAELGLSPVARSRLGIVDDETGVN